MKRRNTDVVIWADFFESLIEKIESPELDYNPNHVGEYVVTDTENFTIYSIKSEKEYRFTDLEKIVGSDCRTQKITEVFGRRKCGVRYLEEIQCMAEICHQYEVQESWKENGRARLIADCHFYIK